MKKKLNDYSRRNFLKLAGSTALVGTIHHSALSNYSFLAPQQLLKNEDDREQYALDLLTRLCTDIGPRATGTPQYAEGIRIIKKEMERSLPLVRFDEYKFEQWELIGEPEFFVGRQYIETYPAAGTPATPASGLSGVLGKTEHGFFALLDPDTKKYKAIITVNSYGRAIPVNYHRGPAKGLNVPAFGIGKQDLPLIEYALKKQITVKLKNQVRFIPNSKGINAVGQLPGQTSDEILIIGHADTVYSSPGAIDNTASVVVMLMLAHALAGKKFKHTITFLATDAEEYTYLGAKHYAEQRTKEGTMKNIKYVVNFDSLAWGPNLWFNSFDDELKEILHTIHKDLNINTTPIFKESDGFTMDSSLFRDSGARAVHVNSRGYDEKTLPLYHRPDDDARHVPLDCLEIAFQVFHAYINRIDKL